MLDLSNNKLKMKTINKLLAISAISLLIMSCSSEEVDELQDPAPNDNVSDGSGDGGQTTATVFERLHGSTFRQIESTDDCATCQDEINYYIFSSDALQITGTKLDDTCEQNDLQPIGTCTECATVQEDSVDKLTICLDSLCQTITFLSDDEIQFDFPAFDQKWTAQRFSDQPPCTEWDPVGSGPDTVLGRLAGKTFRQIETTDSCANCEDEINYYMFSEEGLRITGTTLEGECEQNDYADFGGDYDIEINSNDVLRVCTGTFVRLCQEITFLSDTEIQFVFNTPTSTNTWTAQLFSEDVPCTQWGFQAFFTSPFSGAFLSDVSYDPSFTGTYKFPSSADSWAGFANSNEGIYPMTFPNGGSITFTAATAGVDIDVYIRLERLPYLDSDPSRVEPSYDASSITISGSDPNEYNIEIEPQGSNTYSSMIFYLMTRDQELTMLSEFDINTN
jgi:hypothetical protein